MKIDLKDYLNKQCKITLKNDRIYICEILFDKVTASYFIQVNGSRVLLYYYPNGLNVYSTSIDIIHIEELSMNTQQISEEINKVQAQLESLQVKLKQAEAQEKFNSEFFTPITIEDKYVNCLKFLKTKDVHYISKCFDWDQTPQGHGYWKDIAIGDKSLDESDIQQIKDWVINYLIQKDLRW